MEGYPECPICLDIYGIDQSHIRAPKVLNCGDTLCKECLGNIIKKSTEEEFFDCPVCKEKIKKKDIDEFITNKEIIRLVNGIFNIPKEEAENENEIENNKPISYKIISLGSAGVGKTTIFGRIIEDKFIEKYTITLGIQISQAYYVKYKNIKYKLLFYDTCGQERMASSQIPKNYLRNSDGVLFIYDISNIGTFNDLKNWYDLYKEEKENIVGVLIGNKCDIERQVSYDEAKKFADELGLEYFEVSAKLDKNVKKAIAFLLSEIIESKKNYDVLSSVNRGTTFVLDQKKLRKESFCSRFCKKFNPKNW